MLINREPLKSQVPSRTIMRLHRTRKINRRFHSQISHAILHDLEINRDDTRHFNSATERDFAISLREVQISDAEFGAGDVDWEVDFAAATEILDVAVSAVFGTTCWKLEEMV